jgi:hypothetical protein
MLDGVTDIPMQRGDKITFAGLRSPTPSIRDFIPQFEEARAKSRRLPSIWKKIG